ncbi:MAG: glycosyltransferase family 39 protein [Candidatus Fermentibacteria bacterium]|nr:glycosyltransferase family 39 protein [Candidatus Fermentibacteria bacterium]
MQLVDESKPRFLIVLLSGISLLTRLLFLGRKSFWIDECLAWGASRMDWHEMIRAVSAGTPHPPLAFVLMKLSSLFAGDGEFGLRFLIAVLVASAVIPVFRLASRRTTVRGGFWAGMVWAVSPFAVSMGQEAWVYGVNLAISLWFADFADLAWRGHRKGFVGAILLGITGILTQHIFVLSVIAGSVLYFTIDPSERVSFKRFIIVPGVLAVLYSPIFLFFSAQFLQRSARMISAGQGLGLSRLLSTQPVSQFFRIFSGGLLPELSSNLLDRPRMLSVYVLNAAMVLFLAVWPYFTRILKKGERRYLWLCLIMPFGLFLTDSPTTRQLSVIWIPIVITSAALFSRYRWLGITVSIFCLFLLVPYYAMEVFPYHRSDWRTAVETVESISQPEDIVVVFGGKSTSFAWEFYSNSDIVCLTPGGGTPFAGSGFDPDGARIRNRVEPELFLDSIYTCGNHRRVWVILDRWGIPSIQGVKGKFAMNFFFLAGDDMEVGLLEDACLE